MIPDDQRSLLSILDLDRQALTRLVDRGLELAREFPAPHACTARMRRGDRFAGKLVGLVFTKQSTRTDAAIVRTDGSPEELQTLRRAADGMPIINALCHREHPTQAIADLVTIKSEFPSFGGVHALYVGLPCNTMNSLVLASAMAGLRLTVLNPAPGGDDGWLRESVAQIDTGSVIRFVGRWQDVETPVDVVYATRWESMGRAPTFEGWRELRWKFALDEARVARLLSPRRIVLHDLPATRGGEVTDAVLDGPRSRIRAQAFNKGIAAVVALERALAE